MVTAGDLEVYSTNDPLQTPHAAGIQQQQHTASSSSPMVESPTSTSMARKRTLDMSSTGSHTAPKEELSILVNSLPSSPVLIPSFELDGISVASSSSPYAGSVSTLASSPMLHSNSSQSSFASIEGSEMESGEDETFLPRPEIKRRRTAPGSMTTPTRAQGIVLSEKRGNGKDGQDVWPADVEEAFHGGELPRGRPRF